MTINETKLEDGGTFACNEDPGTDNFFNYWEVIILGKSLFYDILKSFIMFVVVVVAVVASCTGNTYISSGNSRNRTGVGSPWRMVGV